MRRGCGDWRHSDTSQNLFLSTTAGMVGILFLGGWLALNGRSDVGTVVASLTVLTRIEGPWRELVSFFRNASAVRVKYAMLVGSIRPRLVDVK